MRISEQLAEEIAGPLNDGPGVVPRTLVQFSALLATDPQVAASVARWGADDTAVRDELANLVVRHLGVGRSWPTYGQATEAQMALFQADVERAARQAGWHVVDAEGRWPGLQPDRL